jgi:multicomponent Na+:H+ antiporter subunit C
VEPLLAFVVGGLYAAGLYSMMRRSLAKLIIGLVLLSNGANLLLFTAARLTRARPPLIPEGTNHLIGPIADPATPGLILTAIVISFGVLAFALVLIHRVYQTVGTDDLL